MMNLETRKLEFIQDFLKLQNEDVITILENTLKRENTFLKNKEYKPFLEEELNKRIDQSESDFANKKFKSSEELLAKYK